MESIVNELLLEIGDAFELHKQQQEATTNASTLVRGRTQFAVPKTGKEVAEEIPVCPRRPKQIPYSGKFSLGAVFHSFHRWSHYSENKNHKHLDGQDDDILCGRGVHVACMRKIAAVQMAQPVPIPADHFHPHSAPLP